MCRLINKRLLLILNSGHFWGYLTFFPIRLIFQMRILLTLVRTHFIFDKWIYIWGVSLVTAQTLLRGLAWIAFFMLVLMNLLIYLLRLKNWGEGLVLNCIWRKWWYHNLQGSLLLFLLAFFLPVKVEVLIEVLICVGAVVHKEDAEFVSPTLIIWLFIIFEFFSILQKFTELIYIFY